MMREMVSRNICVLSRSVKIQYFRGYSSLSSVTSTDNKCSTTYQPIADFYSGKSVFITGGTGFLGKVFIEKLLYSCTQLEKIYLLIREKKGENVNKRIENMFDNPLFARLKESIPDYLNKVVPITGDMRLPNLGLKPEDEQALIDNVSVVFHSAAATKFNLPLPVIMNVNFEGTQKILKLSQRMKNMEAFVYISTAYAFTENKVLLETTYPSPAKVDDVYKFMEEYGHDTEETMKFINEKPNTYAFTKALSEAYVATNHGDMPTVIIRPSLVTTTKDEPIKGWLENWHGPTLLLYNTATGWNRIYYGDENYCLDLIPADYVSNMTIVAAAKANKSKEIQVFNCTTSSENPLMWGDIHKYFNQEVISRGKNEVPYPSIIFTKSRALVDIGTFILQTTPAHIADLWLKMNGREAKYVKILSQVVSIRNALSFFIINSWVLRAERGRELYTSLSPEDKKQFPCDPTQIVWSEYLRNYFKGVQRYLKPRYTSKL